MKSIIRDKKSDEMFVHWSRGRGKDSWDVRAVADIINERDLQYGLDVGGGIGTFANAVVANCPNVKNIQVVDPSISAANAFEHSERVKFVCNSIQNFDTSSKYNFITFNLVLHHIVERSDDLVYSSQMQALARAKSLLAPGGVLFVEENIYNSVFSTDLTGRIIFEITKLKSIETVTRKLGANTAGEGVRFRSEQSWKAIFASLGLRELQTIDNLEWGSRMPAWQKIPLLCVQRYQKIFVLSP